MRKILILAISSLVLLMTGCIPSPEETLPEEKVEIANYMDFKAPLSQLWTAVITSITDLDWETEFIDKDARVIKFRTSYVYSDLLEHQYFRIYHWPKKFEAEYSYVDKRIQRLSTCPKLTFDHYVFSKENLSIQVKQLDENLSRVQINFNIQGISDFLGFKPGGSNGDFEKILLSTIQNKIEKGE